jgi:drug/metabolite transporter (DMT)-like permease
MRVLLGIALIGVGLLKHNATPLIVIGAVVGLLGVASVVGSAARGSDDGDGQGTP